MESSGSVLGHLLLQLHSNYSNLCLVTEQEARERARSPSQFDELLELGELGGPTRQEDHLRTDGLPTSLELDELLGLTSSPTHGSAVPGNTPTQPSSRKVILLEDLARCKWLGIRTTRTCQLRKLLHQIACNWYLHRLRKSLTPRWSGDGDGHSNPPPNLPCASASLSISVSPSPEKR